jgi:DNA polymerase-1
MDLLSETYLRYRPVSIETLIVKRQRELDMSQVPVEQVKEYAAEDADVTLQLRTVFEQGG